MKLNQILTLLATIGMITINVLANALPINGINTGEISDQFPVLFTPAGYVFSIWGVIYLLLIAFSINQALPSQRDNPRLDRIRGWYIISSILNSVWIFLWHYGFFTLTLLVMLGLLGSLIAIYLLLRRGRERVSRVEYLLTFLPFSVYLGWISVATIANASVTLYNLGWNGGPIAPAIWTVVMILIASVLGVLMLLRQKDIAYVLVLGWAFIGIAVRQNDVLLVAVVAAVAAAALLVFAAFQMVQQRAFFPPQNLVRS